MASSKDAGPAGRISYGPICPARTPGPLGINDQADPNAASFLGNTPGPVGVKDHGESMETYLPSPEQVKAIADQAFSPRIIPVVAGGTAPVAPHATLIYVTFGAGYSLGRGIVGIIPGAEDALGNWWLNSGLPTGYSNSYTKLPATPNLSATEVLRYQSSKKPVCAAPNKAAEESASKFPNTVIVAAQASQRKWDIPTSVTLAQWALESNYGKSMPSGSNNPFGIKAKPGQASVEAQTKEETGGKMISTKAPFRKFASLDEAFEEHARLLATAGSYAKARANRKDPDKFAASLTGVYATDSRYGEKLKKIMSVNDLYQFDVAN